MASVIIVEGKSSGKKKKLHLQVGKNHHQSQPWATWVSQLFLFSCSARIVRLTFCAICCSNRCAGLQTAPKAPRTDIRFAMSWVKKETCWSKEDRVVEVGCCQDTHDHCYLIFSCCHKSSPTFVEVLCQIILVQPENRTQFSQLGLCLRRHLWWQLEGKSITRNPSYHQLSDVSRPTEMRDVPGLPFSMGKMNMVSGRLRVSTFWDNPMRGPKEILLNSTWE